MPGAGPVSRPANYDQGDEYEFGVGRVADARSMEPPSWQGATPPASGKAAGSAQPPMCAPARSLRPAGGHPSSRPP